MNRARRAVAAVLAAAFAVLLPAAVTGAWIHDTILSTSGYVAAVTPVAASPAVRTAVQDAVTSQVGAALSQVETSLPAAARLPAALLGTGLARLAGNEASQLMASRAFGRWWADANRLAHRQLISVLNGDSALVAATGREVVLNLPPLVNGTASAARTRIPLFPAAALAGPRHAYRVLVATLSLVPVLTALALAGALAASPRRRRTLLQLAIGGTLAVLVVMIAASWAQSSLIGRAAPRYQAVTGVVVHALTGGFFTMSTWCAAGGVVTAIALLSVSRWSRPP